MWAYRGGIQRKSLWRNSRDGKRMSVGHGRICRRLRLRSRNNFIDVAFELKEASPTVFMVVSSLNEKALGVKRIRVLMTILWEMSSCDREADGPGAVLFRSNI